MSENEIERLKKAIDILQRCTNYYYNLCENIDKYKMKFDPFDNQEDDFTFVYNGKRYYASTCELDREIADKYRNEYFKSDSEETGNESQNSNPSSEWYENRYQSDCITINQLNVTIDTLVDKLAQLRKNTGLS